MVGVRKRSRVNYKEPNNNVEETEDQEEVHSEEEDVQEEVSDAEEEEELAPPQRTPRQIPSRQRKRRAADALPDMAGDTTLISAVRSPSAAITMAAKDWVDRLRADKQEATGELLTFLLQACGITTRVVTAEEAVEMAADDLKGDVDAIAQDEGLEETLGGRAARHVKASYRELWDKLLREAAAAGLLHGASFLDILSHVLIALSTSVVREFRRVATMTACQVATSLLHVAATLGESRDTAASQAAAEETRGKGGRGGKAASDRAAAFTRQVTQATSAIQELLSHVDNLFQSICAIRYRDIDLEIRVAVVEAVGRWMVLLPATFLTSSYLKYIAWALSDKDAAVRMAAASALVTLYSDAANATQLYDFTERFKERFKELAYDKEDAVAVAGVRLVTLLVRLGHLPATAGGRVFRLMSDASPAIRAAAAELAVGMLKDLGKQAMDSAAASKETAAGGSKRGGGSKKGARTKPGASANASGTHTDEELELAGVLHVLRMLATEEAGAAAAAVAAESGEDEAAQAAAAAAASAAAHETPLDETTVALVVSALVDRSPALRNWQLMVQWLKDDVAVDIFGDASSFDLAACLLTALRGVATGTGTAPARGAGAKEKLAKARNAARQEATLVLQNDLKTLVKKFQSEPALVARVVRLVPELKLEVFSLRRQEKSLAQLLSAVKDVFFKHPDGDAAAACADALTWCAREGPGTTRDAARAVLAECGTAVATELDKAVARLESSGKNSLRTAREAFTSTDGDDERGVLFNARTAAAHAAALVEAHPGWLSEDAKARGALSRILEVAAGTEILPATVIFHAGRASLLALAYELSQLDQEDPDASALGDLAAEVSSLAGQMESISTAAAACSEDHVRHAASSIQADLMAVFSAETLPSTLQEAAYRPSDAAVNAFWEGMQTAMMLPETLKADWRNMSSPASVLPSQLPLPAEVVGRLCACESIPQSRRLASQLLSYWEDPEAPLPNEIAKELMKRLKSKDVQQLPGIYLGAMQACYLRCKATSHEWEDAIDQENAMEPFLGLSHRIAQSQAALNAPVSVMAYVTQEGALWALQDAPERLDFLNGPAYFISRVKGPAAATVLEAVEAAAVAAGAPENLEDEDEEVADAWMMLNEYCDLLRKEVSKGQGSGMRRAGGGSKARGGANAANKPPRRISFAPGVGSDDEGEGPVEEEPAAPAVLGTSSRGKAQKATRNQRAKQRAAPAKRAAKQASPPQEDEGEDSEEELMADMMPTEEQLPGMQRGGRRGGASKPAVASDTSDSEDEAVAHARRRRRR